MSLAPGLVYALFVASAINDCNEEQRVVLRAALKAPMDHYKRTGRPQLTVETIYNVLGESWAPSGEYREMINDLISGMEEE